MVSSYVVVSQTTGKKPIFGRIEQLFEHKFGEYSNTWANVFCYSNDLSQEEDSRIQECGVLFLTLEANAYVIFLHFLTLWLLPLVVADENPQRF